MPEATERSHKVGKFEASMYATMWELVTSNYFIKLHAILNHYDPILFEILLFNKTHGMMKINNKRDDYLKMAIGPLNASLKTEWKQIMKLDFLLNFVGYHEIVIME
jgi:hypothetical protein